MSFDKRVWKGAVFVSFLLILVSANAAAWDPADMKNEMDQKFEQKFGDSSTVDITVDTSDAERNTETITQRNSVSNSAPSWFSSSANTRADDDHDNHPTWDWGTSPTTDSSEENSNTIDRSSDRDSTQDRNARERDSSSNSDSSEPSSTTSGSTEEQAEQYLRQYINEERQSRGIGSLSHDSGLQTTARAKSQDMADRGYFAHTSPSGENFRDLYNRHGVSCSRGGENLARTWYQRTVSTDVGSVNYDGPKALAEGLTRQWMGSSSHRKAMLRSSYNNVGVGIDITSNGRVYATAHFCT